MTPGPWRKSLDMYGDPVVLDHDRKVICRMPRGTDPFGAYELAANYDAIAALPGIVEAVLAGNLELAQERARPL
ncbi:MAG: hypothetical protein ACREKE_04550 [bacterium]